ncbi:alpha-hydroxy-acid oxidizing protein [Haloarchaeobius sp. HME9146]|uniref:alpha-hydroxy-acid oxidizing protein n=1 Tax=Haloarchaeobius sp. HME9146 TaxID=2978732 RepID=UPI0021C0F658|nr:alpha-hydroxy-acid oxidizing protein [Haloarchaeobius sp. HME9146]MCT9098125.1 alpha-hydroxy-acid oxidizing protein [Haloarchaeobius sp. HME9146]
MSDDNTSTPYGRFRQTTVYTTGMLTGETPEIPPAYEALKQRAAEELEGEAYDYVAGGAGSESTKHHNRVAFGDYRIVPRVMRDTAERDLSVEVFGQSFDVPVLLAPIGAQGILHEDGDLASARAAARLNMPYVCSTQSSEPLEDVAEELGDTPKWFQLYWSEDRELTESLVHRAEDSGYDALVVTLDTPHLGWRERDVSRGFLPFLAGDGIANYASDPVFRDRLAQPPEENEQAAAQEFVEVFSNPSLTWPDLDWLAGQTDLPIVCKGILHPDDAEQAVEHGADGVVVSNHGGRQVDGEVAALRQLPTIARRIGGDATLIFDSGIRRGADAVKALALGADAVMLGRPYAYGLGIDGEDGVHEVLENFLADFDLTVALTGHDTAGELDRDVLVEA